MRNTNCSVWAKVAFCIGIIPLEIGFAVIYGTLWLIPYCRGVPVFEAETGTRVAIMMITCPKDRFLKRVKAPESPQVL